MQGLGDWIHAQETYPGSGQYMKYGLYSCRGTCQCSTSYYSGPGSYGYEQLDTDWMVNAGADWLKIDSCCGSQDHAEAFREYGLWRDALNSTGKSVYFNLCGWNSWYSPPDPSINYTGGASLGNSWRISGDGGSYGAISTAINTMATLYPYNNPGGWNDPDNLLGQAAPSFQITLAQSLTQMILWSVFPTQIILGEDVTRMSDEFLNIVNNTELIAINQDSPFVGSGQRISGNDLTWPCSSSLPTNALYNVQTLPCNTSNPLQFWYYNQTDMSIRLNNHPQNGVLTYYGCNQEDGTLAYVYPAGTGNGNCNNQNQQWVYLENGNQSIVNPYSGKCLDEYMWTTPRVDLWTCVPHAPNEAWNYTGSYTTNTENTIVPGQFINQDSGYCLTAVDEIVNECTNIWARPLSTGATVLAMVNNGDTDTTVTCNSTCFALANLTSTKGYKVRDVVQHMDLGTIYPPYSFSMNVSSGGSSTAVTMMEI